MSLEFSLRDELPICVFPTFLPAFFSFFNLFQLGICSEVQRDFCVNHKWHPHSCTQRWVLDSHLAELVAALTQLITPSSLEQFLLLASENLLVFLRSTSQVSQNITGVAFNLPSKSQRPTQNHGQGKEILRCKWLIRKEHIAGSCLWRLSHQILGKGGQSWQREMEAEAARTNEPSCANTRTRPRSNLGFRYYQSVWFSINNWV